MGIAAFNLSSSWHPQNNLNQKCRPVPGGISVCLNRKQFHPIWN
jgi:hypothetical protein